MVRSLSCGPKTQPLEPIRLTPRCDKPRNDRFFKNEDLREIAKELREIAEAQRNSKALAWLNMVPDDNRGADRT